MRVLWTHNFDPDSPTSGVFMHTAARGIAEKGIDLQLEYLGNLRSISQINRARKLLRAKAREFDLVHAQYGSACAFATTAAESIPKLVSIRGSDWQNYRSAAGFLSWHSRLASTLTKLSIKHFDCVMSVSKRMATELARYAPESRVEVVPSPIDLDRFVPRDKAEARKMLGMVGNGEKWVLFNSRSLDNPVKRFSLAKAAFEMAKKRDRRLRLRVATDMSHEEMPLFVAACDVILCTSEHEGWPNSVKEALACNIPFVSTDVGDLANIASVEHSCRVCSADPVVIADNLCDVVSIDGNRELRQFVEEMSLNAISDRLVSIYQSLMP